MMQEENPADYEAMLAAGQENARYTRMMQEQKERAATLREQGAAPKGQMVSGHYVAPHATQHLGSLANNLMAGRADQQASESGAGLERSMGGQNSLVLKALMRNRQAAQPAQMPVPSGMPTEPYDY